MLVAHASPVTPQSPVRKVRPSLATLIQKESGGSLTAKNPKSSAFGKYQMLIGNRKHYGLICGVAYDTIIESEQDCMGDNYIKDRYGSVEKALAFHLRNNWY